jgi:hypothetical protein
MSNDALSAALEAATGLSADALHIYAAVLAQMLVAAVMRRSLAHPLPWLAALLVAVAGQWTMPGEGSWAVGIAYCMAIPTVLLILARFAPALLRPPPGDTDEAG